MYGVQRQRPDRRLELPYLPLDQVEDAVAAQWYREVFPPELIAACASNSPVVRQSSPLCKSTASQTG